MPDAARSCGETLFRQATQAIPTSPPLSDIFKLETDNKGDALTITEQDTIEQITDKLKNNIKNAPIHIQSIPENCAAKLIDLLNKRTWVDCFCNKEGRMVALSNKALQTLLTRPQTKTNKLNKLNNLKGIAFDGCNLEKAEELTNKLIEPNTVKNVHHILLKYCSFKNNNCSDVLTIIAPHVEKITFRGPPPIEAAELRAIYPKGIAVKIDSTEQTDVNSWVDNLIQQSQDQNTQSQDQNTPRMPITSLELPEFICSQQQFTALMNLSTLQTLIVNEVKKGDNTEEHEKIQKLLQEKTAGNPSFTFTEVKQQSSQSSDKTE